MASATSLSHVVAKKILASRFASHYNPMRYEEQSVARLAFLPVFVRGLVPHSTTHWVNQLKAGNRDAAQELWERYYRRLVNVARKQFRGGGAADGSDIAQSAFASFYRAAEQGRFPQLGDRTELWKLLMVITQRKIARRLRYDNRQKRRPPRTDGREIGDPVELHEVAGSDPTPDFCVAAIESIRELLDRLSDSTLRSLALLKMEGFTNEEIARRLDCSLTTIERKLRRIRHEWADAVASTEHVNE